MKKEYETPKAEKLEFDYKETVVASNTRCFIAGMSATWRDSNGHCENYVAGDE